VATLPEAAPMTDMFQPRYWRNPDDAEWQRYPVQRVTLPDRCPAWVISGYDAVRDGLLDEHRLRKDADTLVGIMLRKARDNGATHTEKSAIYGRTMLFSDAAEHQRLRAVLRKHFTQDRVTALLPQITEICTSLLDGLTTGEPVDLMREVALPLPLTVICRLLGLPYTAATSGPLREWTAALMQDVPETTDPASEQLVGFLLGVMEEKLATKPDDLFSGLLTQLGDGADQLSPVEVIATVVLMIVAGHETTTNAIVRALAILLQEPGELWLAVQRDPGKIRNAVDEALRLTAPVRSATHRFTAEPYPAQDVVIPAGEIVLLSIAHANRDPRRFPDADRFVLDRDTTSHLTFGHGPHYCLGAGLAREEITIALTQLIARYPRARLAVPAEELEHQASPVMHGLTSLPVALLG
jgi:cytochrome P450